MHESLKGQSVVVFDLEIKEPIDGTKVTWSTYDRMGISVGVSFDYRDCDTRVFMDDNIGELIEQLHSADLVVGFNTTGFDNRLLRGMGLGLRQDADLPNYDMLTESRKGVGWREGDRFPSNCKLDNHLEAMFGIKKTADGAQAPHMYQAKQLGKLISYCCADVKRECQLFEHIWEFGWVKTLAHGQKTVADPRDFMRKK